MNIHDRSPDERNLSATLVERLRPLMAPKGTAGRYPHGRQLFSYCSIERERLKAIELASPIVGIVLRGLKEVWLGDTTHRLEPGTVFVMPARVRMDIVNIPPSNAASYESLLLEIEALPAGISPIIGCHDDDTDICDFRVPLNTDMVDALVHAATAVADTSVGETIKMLRLMEVLTLMQPFAAARPLFRASLSDEVAWLIRSAPSEVWTVERVAGQIGLGASTLRRRLALEDQSFRKILRAERLKAGRRALQSGASSIAAAEAAGYASRSHFARRYRELFGSTPTGRIR